MSISTVPCRNCGEPAYVQAGADQSLCIDCFDQEDSFRRADCPVCGAEVTHPCVDESGEPRPVVYDERLEAVSEVTREQWAANRRRFGLPV